MITHCSKINMVFVHQEVNPISIINISYRFTTIFIDLRVEAIKIGFLLLLQNFLF